MDFKLPEAARALGMTERELLRLVRQGVVPACRVDEQYLFHPVELQAWGVEYNRRLAQDILPPNGEPPQTLSLARAVERGGIHYDVAGTSRNEVLDAVAWLPGVPDHVDRGLLAEVLRARERLASTGVGRGIGLPHPRDPLILNVATPIVLLCFLTQGVDFGAIDGQSARVLFTLLSPTVPLHLRLLARLTHALHDATLFQLLVCRAKGDRILERLRMLECDVDTVDARDGL